MTMARQFLLLVALLLHTITSASTDTLQVLLHFQKDRSELLTEAASRLDSLLSVAPLSGDHHFTVQGHTDSDGDLAYNEALSLARAEEVRNYLVAHGADPTLVSVERYGERDPMASNARETGMALNRRVVVTYVRHYFADTDELRRALMAGTVQHFTIDPSQDQTIVGTAGVQVRFAANAFVDAQGRVVQGPVHVELTEALGLQAMLAHQLGTRSGERLLETGGMLRVQARDTDGNALRLAAASPMDIAVPKEDQMPGMELFLSSDGRDWSATGRPLQETVVTTWREPRYPAPPQLSYRLPRYIEDQKGRPVKPVAPVMPRRPIEPRRASYAAARPWWSFLFPARATRQADARYNTAMERHAKQMERHARRMAAYEAERASFPERLARYEERMAAWSEQKAAEYAQWHTNVYQPELDRTNALYAPIRQRYDSLVANWEQMRAESLRRYTLRADSMGTADMGGLNAYVFSTAQLGWINCDRFINVPEAQKYQVIAQGDHPRSTEAYLVFTRIRSILPMERNVVGELCSPPVARNEPAVLFAYTVIDGRAHVCKQAVTPNTRPELRFEPSSYAEIGRILKELGHRPS